MQVQPLNTWEQLDWVQLAGGFTSGAGSCCGWSGATRWFLHPWAIEVILAAINTNLFEFVNLHYYYFSSSAMQQQLS